MKNHSICHIEWQSSNLSKTRSFLFSLFGWKFKPYGMEYLMFTPPDGVGGGIMKVKKVMAGASPVVYVLVNKIEPYLAKARKLGGKVAVPKTEIPKMGWFAYLKDRDGNLYGLFQNQSG